MKQFLIFIFVVFGSLTFFYFRGEEKNKKSEEQIIQVYASSSFVAKWGPAPALKELFEKQNLFKVEFVESPDIGMTIQKINFEKEASAVDVVIGMDQFDVARIGSKLTWRELTQHHDVKYVAELKNLNQYPNFVAYDWAPISLVTRKSLSIRLADLKDLLQPALKNKVALQDPRTSSLGLQFLSWVFETRSDEEAIKYLRSISKQAHSFSPSWSAAYGLFKNNQTDVVLSYVTSPIYHIVEENDSQFASIETAEPLPIQVEFAGIPNTCRNCEAAELFLNFLLTPDAQKILMNKNYMLPVIGGVKEGTHFDGIKIYKTLPLKVLDQAKLEKWVNIWSDIRKNDSAE